MNNYRALAFIIVVLLASWVVQFVLFSGMLPGNYLFLYMYVPALIAFIFFMFKKNPIKSQARLFTNKTSLWAWGFAILYPFFWMSIVIFTAVVTGLGKFNAGFIPALLGWPFLAGFAVMVISSLPNMFGEEYGWRGYLLPALAEKHNKVLATVILGIVWGLWHIPSYYIIYSKAGLGDPVLLTILGVIAVAVGAFPYTYLFFLNGNIIPCVLMHAVYDLTASRVIFGTPALPGLSEEIPGLLTIPWPYAQCLLIVTGAALAYFLARKMK